MNRFEKTTNANANRIERTTKPKKANIDHIAHQVNVSGIGYHKNKKKEIPRKNKYKEKHNEKNKI